MNIEQALRQSLDLLALRVTSNRGGYPKHDPIPSDYDAIANLAASLAARTPAPDTGELAWLREALTDEDEIAHGEAWHNDLGLGRCAYCNDDWPCRTQRGINRLLARLCQSGIDRCHECAVAAVALGTAEEARDDD